MTGQAITESIVRSVDETQRAGRGSVRRNGSALQVTRLAATRCGCG